MAAIRTFQVTIGAGATKLGSQLPANYPPLARHIILQNNAAATMRVGDSTVTAAIGYSLAATAGVGNPFVLGPLEDPIDLNTVFVIGTAAQVLDVTYSD